MVPKIIDAFTSLENCILTSFKTLGLFCLLFSLKMALNVRNYVALKNNQNETVCNLDYFDCVNKNSNPHRLEDVQFKRRSLIAT